jgi:hypothetical protein
VRQVENRGKASRLLRGKWGEHIILIFFLKRVFFLANPVSDCQGLCGILHWRIVLSVAGIWLRLKMGRSAKLISESRIGVKHIDVPIAPWKIWKILNEKGISK